MHVGAAPAKSVTWNQCSHEQQERQRKSIANEKKTSAVREGACETMHCNHESPCLLVIQNH
jgi:hypothetical protein